MTTARSTRLNATSERGVSGRLTRWPRTAKRRDDGSVLRVPSMWSGAVACAITVRPSDVVKCAATIAFGESTPCGTLNDPEKKPVPFGKNGLKKTMTIGCPKTKNCGPGANTEKPGGKNPNLGNPNIGVLKPVTDET